MKNTVRIRPEDLRGLAAFGEDYPRADLVLLYRGARRERRNKIWIMPVDRFLASLPPERKLPLTVD